VDEIETAINKLSKYAFPFKIESIDHSSGILHQIRAFFLYLHQYRKELNQFDFIYTRSLVCFFILGLFVKDKLVMDFRGLLSSESYFKNQSTVRFLFFRLLEKYTVLRAKRIQAVSKTLLEVLKVKNGSVVPSCVRLDSFFFSGSDRELIRKKFGIGTDIFVVTYLGGLSVWQETDLVIRSVSEFIKKNTSAYFFFFTKDTALARQKLEDGGIDLSRVLLKSLSRSEVSQHLSASDIGIILRRNNIVNRVASPIKVAEYLATGNMVLTTNYVGDLSASMKKAKVSTLVDLEQSDIVKKLLDLSKNHSFQIENREKMLRFAENHLTFDGNIETYINLYSD
jgi:glycosyltransferase involved in cell wall biosynthesis